MNDFFKFDKKFWDDVELQIKGAIPETIKHVFKASGYENLLSLRDLTKDDLAAIENFVNINLAPWLKKLRKLDKNNEYAKINPFVFLPGHEKLIFKISADLRVKNEINCSNVNVPDKHSDLMSNRTLCDEPQNCPPKDVPEPEVS